MYNSDNFSANPFDNDDIPYDEDEIFHIERLEWHPSREQGSLTSLAIGSNTLLIATKHNFLIRWNIETDAFEEIQISKKSR